MRAENEIPGCPRASELEDEEARASEAATDLHWLLHETLDVMLADGLAEARAFVGLGLRSTDFELGWGAVSAIAHAKSAMQTTR